MFLFEGISTPHPAMWGFGAPLNFDTLIPGQIFEPNSLTKTILDETQQFRSIFQSDFSLGTAGHINSEKGTK